MTTILISKMKRQPLASLIKPMEFRENLYQWHYQNQKHKIHNVWCLKHKIQGWHAHDNPKKKNSLGLSWSNMTWVLIKVSPYGSIVVDKKQKESSKHNELIAIKQMLWFIVLVDINCLDNMRKKLWHAWGMSPTYEAAHYNGETDSSLSVVQITCSLTFK